MLDARIKIAALFVYSIAIFFVYTWPIMGLFIVLAGGAVVASAMGGHVPLGRFLLPLIPVVVLALFAFGFGIWNNPTPEGISNATMVSLRMILLALASFTVCYTTTSTQLLDAFKWFLKPLRTLHLPVDDICFVLSMAIRFIPQIALEYQMVVQAQKCRGATLPNMPVKRRLSNAGAAFSAVFIGLFRHANSIATAMDARCYGLTGSKEAPSKGFTSEGLEY